MASKKPVSRQARIAKPSPAWEKTGVARLYKRVGKQRISWIYKHVDGRSQTLASCALGDRSARYDAERLATKLAVEIQQGVVVAGAVSEMIERFELKEDPTYYQDQSKDGKKIRKGMYTNLTKFFGRMVPSEMTAQHGYQYLEDRAAAGAPIKANKELSQFSVICHFGVRWGLLAANPFVNMMKNRSTTEAKIIDRRQVLRFYLWSVKQRENYRTMGCAAMFTYLTGFRSSEARPFLKTGLTHEGVTVLSTKRKKGQIEVVKVREWSLRLRVVVARALDRKNTSSPYLFAPTKRSDSYTRHGWASSWKDAQLAWIRSFDESVTEKKLTKHPLYFNLQDVRPAAITTKIQNRDHDAYDFAAHANPATTHKHYDRRIVKKASATE
ncbi:hypothetical protein H4P35_18755 [Achromobacter sp. 77]|uniref:hypothetical protein n=1 Tax=Achromobacter sp. 77 TaxID=2756133 RepID=UPI001D0172E1|nr:hypothetical protein [Achromobacter sp. 77]UDG78615.1 hypothetical protein H4P35_18755 [Achromobacter sp. 77]